MDAQPPNLVDRPSVEGLTIPLHQQPAKSLLDILSLYPIFSNICSRLTIAELITLRKLSKRLHGDLDSHEKQRWNINTRLRRFLWDPVAFRSQMGKYDALISGSFAIQFFDHVSWTESDLDIFVEGEENSKAMGRYLMEQEKYNFVERTPDQPTGYADKAVIATDTFIRKEDGNETKIQIVTTVSVPAHAILTGFYTTAVVNFISWNKAYSMFPRLTFLEPRRTIPLMVIDQACAPQITKYIARGWTLVKVNDETTKKDEILAAFPTHSSYSGVPSDRRVGDSKCWTMTLDTVGVAVPTTPDYVLSLSVFGIASCHCGEMITGPLHYHIHAWSRGFYILKYRYLWHQSSRKFWEGFMEEKEIELTIVEIEKMPKEDRPAWFARLNERTRWQLLQHSSMNFEKPDTWTYYDDQVKGWYEEWQTKKLQEQALPESLNTAP